MKKILKKEVIIAFIVGIILASSIAVYAYSCAAKDVSYTKPGTTTAINVETALNELYSKNNSEIIFGKNNKKYKLLSDFKNNESTGYIPILTSDNSSNLGRAYSDLSNAYYALDSNNSTCVRFQSENTSTGYVQWSTTGIMMNIKRMNASVGATGKSYNWYLQYLDMQSNEWITVNSGSVNSGYGTGIDIGGELENAVYTTSVRIYTDSTKTIGNNFEIYSFQVYPL